MRVPSGWSRVQLGEVATLQTGISKSSRIPDRPVLRPYLRVANVLDGALDLTVVKQIAVSADRVSRYELRPGDVLMTEGGDFDKLGRGTVWHGEIPGCLHQNHVFAVRADPRQLLPEYLAAWTTSTVGRRYFRSCSKQTTNLASINSSQVKAAELLLPSLRVQEKAIGLFRGFTCAETLLARGISARLRRRAGLMHQLLTGQRRLPRFAHQAWLERSVGELFEEVSRPIVWDESGYYDLLSIRRRSGGVFVRGRIAAKKIKTKILFEVHSGDLLISRMQAVHGAIGLAGPAHQGMKVSGSYVVLRPKPGVAIRPLFFAFLTQLPEMYRAVLLSSYGVHIEKMTFNLQSYLRTPVRLPLSLEEQDAIVECRVGIDQEVSLLERELELFELRRRALTDRLLSGELSVLLTDPMEAIPA